MRKLGFLAILEVLSVWPASAMLSVTGQPVVSSTRINLFQFDHVVRIEVTNSSAQPYTGVTALVASSTPNIIVLDGYLRIPDVPAFSTVTSTDTYTIRHDRRFPIGPNDLHFQLHSRGRPTANAGPDQRTAVSSTVNLNGGGSYDPAGQPLSFAWSILSKPSGSAAILSSSTAVKPSFVADLAGDYVLQLITTSSLSSVPDTITVSTVKARPLADAGPNQTATVSSTVQLDGGGSSNPNGGLLTYQWLLESRPGGSSAALSSPTSVKPTLNIDVGGTYTVQLIVSDGTLQSWPSIVTISTTNSPPVADAGPDQKTTVSSVVNLNGSMSTDVDGQLLTYNWAMISRPAGSSAALTGATGLFPRFTVDVAGLYVIQLTVSDGVLSHTDTVCISTANNPPVANAGADRTVAVSSNVLLNGSGSFDPDGDSLSYQWAMVSRPAGSASTLSGAATITPSFPADVAGTYVIQLVVNDGFLSSPADTIVVSTINSRPVANAGPDQTVQGTGSVVNLNGNASSDPDSDPLSFRWALLFRPAGSAAALTGATSATPSLIPDVLGFYVAQLIVNAATSNSVPDTVVIRANGVPTANAQNVDAPEGVGVEITLTGSDPDGDTLTFSIFSNPTKGTLSAITPLSPTSAKVTYTAGVGQSGADSFQFQVNDGNGGISTPATVSITIIVPPPVAVNDQFDGIVNTLLEVGVSTPALGVEISGNLLTNDTGTAISASLVSSSPGASVTVNANGTFTYLPPAGQTGSDTFTYRASNASGFSDATVTIDLFSPVWYVDNSASPGGMGRSTDPFNTLSAAETASLVGHTIFVFRGDGTTTGQNAGISLKANQSLIGEGVALVLNRNAIPTTIVPAGLQPLIGNGAGNGVTVNNITGASIRGLNIGATGNAIRGESSGANGVGLTIDSNTIRGAGAQGILINGTGSLTNTPTITNNVITSTGHGIDVQNSTGTTNLTLSNNTNITAGGNGININRASGTLNILGFSGNTVHGDTAGKGIFVNGAVFDAVVGGSIDPVSGGVTTIGSSGNGVGTNGIELMSVTGHLTFSDLDIVNDNGTGLFVSGPGIQVATSSGSTIASTGGPGINISNATGAFTFDSISSTSSTTTGINLVGTTGSFTLGGGAISGPAGTAINIDGGNSTITYNGSVTKNNAGRTVDIQNRGGGPSAFGGTITAKHASNTGIRIIGASAANTVTFTGLVDLGDGTTRLGNTALTYTGANTTTNFNGGLNLFTNGAAAITGNGGTLNSTSGVVNVTGTTSRGIQLTSLSSGLTLSSTTINNIGAGNQGIDLDSVSGSTNFGAVSIGSSGPVGTGIDIQTSSGTFTFGGTTISNATAGISLASNTGTFTFTSLDITNTGGAGLFANSSGTINVSTGSINTTSGAGISITSTGGSFTFSSVSGGGSDKGIFISNTSGTFNIGTGAVSGTSVAGIDINGGAPSFFYGGTIANSSGRTVSVQNMTGGSATISGNFTGSSGSTGILVQNLTSGSPVITFSGLAKNLTTGTNPAVTLDNADNATINFTNGGLVINTTSGRGFNAVNGALGINITGAGNTISSTTGRALNIENSTIGVSGLTFQSISGNGSDIGINLVSTGTSGGLTVSGNGGTCTSAAPTCTGGRIQNTVGADGATAGRGINLDNTRAISLNFMRIDNHSNFGIRGNNVTNFSMGTMLVNGANGTSAAADEGSIRFDNLLGSGTISNSTIRGGLEDNLTIINTSGTLDTQTISNTTFRDNSNSLGNDGIRIEANNAAVVKVNVQNSTFTAHRGDHFDAQANNTATLDIVFTGNTLTGGHANALGQTVVISSAGSALVTFNFSNNSINGAILSALTLFQSNTTTAGTRMSGTISSNTIGTTGVLNSGSAQGHGIALTATGLGTMTVLVSNNQIRQYNDMGINISAGDTAPPLNVTITGNVIKEPQGFALHGIHANIDTTSGGAAFTACLDIGGAGGLANDLVGSGLAVNGGVDIRPRQRNESTIRLPGYGGANNDNTAVATYLQGRNTGTPTVTASNSVPSGGGGFVGGAACTLP